ncbi:MULTISPECIES: hypothetical protein [unclassified Diaminobutyricimonas]|uniref:hypothetical protein n=1 Tax=unclassified Diaminobutyricimonas TaxID=2643261 RepID=UPI0012F49DEB|nr:MULTISPECIES: hypothetical protein [unclassified Diaminobutyricimonas]
MINASASYHFYEIEQQELLRQLEMRRVQLERGAESMPVPSRLRRAVSRLTAVRSTARTERTVRTAARTERAARQPQPAAGSAPCPDPA